jgi:hypothetical protein
MNMRALLVGLLLVMGSGAFAADDVDTPETRRAAAVRYSKVSDFEKQFVAGLEAGLQNLPAEQKGEVILLMKKHLQLDVIESLMVDAMVKTFTTQELDALATFYASGPGKSAMDKMQPFMSSMLPQIQAEMARTLARILEDLRHRRAETGV